MNQETCHAPKKRVNISITEETHQRLKSLAVSKNATVSQLISDWIWEVSPQTGLMAEENGDVCQVGLEHSTLCHLKAYAKKQKVSEKQALSELILKQKVNTADIPGQMSLPSAPKKESKRLMLISYKDTRRIVRTASVRVVLADEVKVLYVLTEGAPFHVIVGRSFIWSYLCIPERLICGNFKGSVGDCFCNHRKLEEAGLDPETSTALSQILYELYNKKKLCPPL